MSTARSAFTEAIEEHLALKKQNTMLEATMPLARYDVGDPLDRYPGGPGRAAEGTVVITDDVAAPVASDAFDAPIASSPMVGPSPEQAMEAATALEPAFADRPFEPLNGMAPMLSLVEDIEDDAPDAIQSVHQYAEETSSADVLRFPGGVGPRDEAAPASEAPSTAFFDEPMAQPAAPTEPPAPAVSDEAILDAPTGEQPVLVIDTDEPLATSGFDEPVEPSRPSRASRTKPRFFGLGRKKKRSGDEAGDNWFTDGPRDFNWD